MFFNSGKKKAAKIIKKAKAAAAGILDAKVDGELSLRAVLGPGVVDGDWRYYAVIAAVFLGFQARETRLKEKEYRKLAVEVKNQLQLWQDKAPESFYDLADFIITSREKGVDSVSATGLWVLIQAKETLPGHEDMVTAHTIGVLLNAAVS